MNIEIDQSGKIEATNRKTIVAFSNSTHRSVSISSKDKKVLQKFFREAGKPEMFIYRVFAILCFYLIKEDIKKIDSIIIDLEYLGKESVVKDLILSLIRRNNPSFDKSKIKFSSITKKSRAHWEGYEVFKGKRKANKNLNYKDILKYII